jgi:nucleoid-associated protein YejK
LLSFISDLLAAEMDRKTADFILSLIQEEEVKSDQLKKQYLHSQVSDLMESSETASAEQSFNREQVQEQEQVCSFLLFPYLRQ